MGRRQGEESMRPRGRSLERILVRRICGLGDLVLTIPWLRALRDEFSTKEVHILCRGEQGELLEGLGIVEKAFPDEGSRWHLLYGEGWRSHLSHLRPDPRSYDGVFSFSSSPEDPIAASLREILGNRAWILPGRPPADYQQHASSFPFSFMGMKWTMERIKELAKLEISIPPLSRESKGEGELLTLHPGSGSSRKNYPPRKFARVMEDLSKEVYCGLWRILEGPADGEAVSRILHFARVPFQVMKPSSLLELVGILSRSLAFLGNDSGVTHLASCLGKRTIAIFGPSNHMVWHPLGPRTKVLLAPERCEPCHLSPCTSCTGPCRRFPSYRAVLSAIMDLIAV
jgi:ADP-heptose:LPS heptosyltransferase